MATNTGWQISPYLSPLRSIYQYTSQPTSIQSSQLIHANASEPLKTVRLLSRALCIRPEVLGVLEEAWNSPPLIIPENSPIRCRRRGNTRTVCPKGHVRN